MPNRPQPLSRSDFKRFVAMTTRLQDNEIYGHMNNVVYGEYFDTAVNQTLIELGVLDMHKSEVIGLVVASHAAYFKSMAFPDKVTIGVRVSRLGRSSVDYEFALVREDDGQRSEERRVGKEGGSTSRSWWSPYH